MINTILITLVIICLIGSTYFSMRQQMKFNEMYAAMLAIRDMTDEKCLEYAGLAQPGEHFPYKEGVGGSNPSSRTNP